MDPILSHLRAHFPTIAYRAGSTFCWSPKAHEVIYSTKHSDNRAIWSLLHETSHALLGHQTYKTDFELLRMEVMAWEKANELARELGITIDENHVQDCLDSYRDWIYARSICPRCTNKSLQQNDHQHYRCFNCHHVWRVTTSRFCRAYRATKHATPAVAQFRALQNL